MVVLTTLQGRRKHWKENTFFICFLPRVNLLDPLSKVGPPTSPCRSAGFRGQPVAHSSARLHDLPGPVGRNGCAASAAIPATLQWAAPTRQLFGEVGAYWQGKTPAYAVCNYTYVAKSPGTQCCPELSLYGQ